MAIRHPLIVDDDSQEVKELPIGDDLDLTGNNIAAVRNIIPEGDELYDLGSSANKWGSLYLSGSTIYLGNLQLKEVGDGSFGIFASDGATPVPLIAETTFTGLADSADATVDQLYLPAITSLTVSNSGTTAYLFDQYPNNNPTIYAISGTTIAFKLNSSGHPFLIQNSSNTNFDTGLVHITTSGTVSAGEAAQGKEYGTLYWKVPYGIYGEYRYRCSLHSSMSGLIIVKDFAVI